MGITSIEWTATPRRDGTFAPGYTFNCWRGCTRRSEGCRFCFAENLSGRNPGVLGEWGPNGKRIVAAESYWQQPLRWNRAAAKTGERRRVFCASLADVFEDWPGVMHDTSGNVLYYNSAATWWVNEPTPHGPINMGFVRKRLISLVQSTPHLDWLFVTKRPENALRMLVEAELYAVANPDLPCPQPNLWIGTSVENQTAADERIPHLLRVPAAVRFLSVEPLLGPVDLRRGIYAYPEAGFEVHRGTTLDGIDWTIVGGESGPHARPMHPQWIRSIRDQCVASGVAFHFKQHGEWLAINDMPYGLMTNGKSYPQISMLPDGRSGDQVTRQVCQELKTLPSVLYRVGKKNAGRLLDGRTWDEFPAPIAVA